MRNHLLPAPLPLPPSPCRFPQNFPHILHHHGHQISTNFPIYSSSSWPSDFYKICRILQIFQKINSRISQKINSRISQKNQFKDFPKKSIQGFSKNQFNDCNKEGGGAAVAIESAVAGLHLRRRRCRVQVGRIRGRNKEKGGAERGFLYIVTFLLISSSNPQSGSLRQNNQGGGLGSGGGLRRWWRSGRRRENEREQW